MIPKNSTARRRYFDLYRTLIGVNSKLPSFAFLERYQEGDVIFLREILRAVVILIHYY